MPLATPHVMPKNFVRFLGNRTSRLWVRFLSGYPKGEDRKGRVGFIEPMLAVAVAKPPEGAAGCTNSIRRERVFGLKANGGDRLFSRHIDGP